MKRPIIEIDEEKCNGCGQCVLDCAEGALAVIDGKARLVSEVFCDGLGACLNCPQGALTLTTREAPDFDEAAALAAKAVELPTWPIQLRLVPPQAPFLDGAHLLLAAHCAGFALPNLHKDWLAGRVPLIACPKLEDNTVLLEKLTAILRTGRIAGLTVLRMSVPCCGGLERLARQALEAAACNLPLEIHVARLS